MDVAPNQIASIAASLIPFLEHDDANRALMGSNMMRQAVPLVTCESPIVGTGIEKDMISDSRIQIIAEGDGEVVFADATKIQIKYQRTEEEVICSFEPEITTYELPRYRRTNQNTSITLKPAVLTGDKVTKGQILTEGYSTQKGELALGRNLKVAFMPWKGYNFEDAIVISERIQREDIFTSVHVDEYIMEVRDTKRGVEELTSDIPNVSEDATKDLDANGIIRIGANVHPGDILIGKITPKGESDPSPEEKLLRAIFGDKAGDVKDASLKAQPSLHGVVIDTKLYSRAGKENKRAGKSSEKLQIEKLDEKFAAQVADLTKQLVNKLYTLLQGKTTTGITDYFGVELYPAGTKFTQKLLDELSRKVTDEKSGVAMGYLNLGTCKWTGDSHLDALVEKTINNYTIEWKKADAAIKREKYNLTNGDELPQTGVIQMAKVYIAKKRKLKVGDKMAGRHGNKGIVARVVRDEDMPSRGRYDRRYLPEPAGCAFAYEPRSDLRNRARLGRQGAGTEVRYADFRRCFARPDQRIYGEGGYSAQRAYLPVRRRYGREVRPAGYGGRDLHAQARPHDRRQDARPFNRSLFAYHAAAARR